MQRHAAWLLNPVLNCKTNEPCVAFRDREHSASKRVARPLGQNEPRPRLSRHFRLNELVARVLALALTGPCLQPEKSQNPIPTSRCWIFDRRVAKAAHDWLANSLDDRDLVVAQHSLEGSNAGG